MVTRKAIAAALLQLLAPPNGPFPTSGRKVPDPETLSGGDFPALFLIKGSETYTYDGEGDTVPPTRVIDFSAVIYTDFSDDPRAVPADAIDDLLDQVDGLIAAQPTDQIKNGGRQTLGDLVYNTVISGELHLAPGDAQGKGMTLIPIRVTLNQYP